ncbi:unnamed protein product [Boreogadus saida]
MIENQEDDEFIAVRVQDPRVQNEGSWNSHVDYKIFLHTNSKSFTAKTSCVRRRYSEFVWLKKKLQKNSGLVPVPGLPNKSFFSSFNNEDFLERRRTGLQSFLDQVLHMTVCLSDSQLHLFMQTQLPVRHIEDCVQGHTPYTVTDAILTYASSNRGFAQAQEDLQKERGSSVVSYESMESPSPHLPSQQPNGDHLQAILETPDAADARRMVCHSERSSLQVLQQDHHLEAVLQPHPPPAASFYAGSSLDEGPSLGSPPEATPAGRMQASVEVHSPMGEAAAPDFREEVEDVEEVEENGCGAAEECLTEMQPTEEVVPRAPSVPVDGVCTDSQEEEVEPQEGEQQAGVVEQQEWLVAQQEEGLVEQEVEVEQQQEEEMKQEVVAEQQQQQEEGLVEQEVEVEQQQEEEMKQEVVAEQQQQQEEVVEEVALLEPEEVEKQEEVVVEKQEEHGNGDSGEVVVEEVVVDKEEEAEKEGVHVNGTGDSGEMEEEEEEEQQRVNGIDDSGDHTEAVCGAGGLLHVVSEQEEGDDEEEEEKETKVNSEQQVLKQTSRAEQEHDEQHDEDTGSLVSLDGIHPTVDPEDAIRNVNGHLEESAEEVAPSTGAEDSSVCDSHTTTRSAGNLIWSEAGDARPAPDEALDLCPTPGALRAGEAPELDATACVRPDPGPSPVRLSQQMVEEQG